METSHNIRADLTRARGRLAALLATAHLRNTWEERNNAYADADAERVHIGHLETKLAAAEQAEHTQNVHVNQLTATATATGQPTAVALAHLAGHTLTPPAEEPATLTTYATKDARTQRTGHYRREGSQDLYCGRPAGAPNDYAQQVKGFRLCTRCVKALALARAAAEDTAAQHRTTPDHLAEWRAALTYGARVWDPIRRQHGTVINPRKTVRLPQGGSVRGAIVEFPHGYTVRVPLADLQPAQDTTAADRAAAVEEARLAAALVTEAEATEGTWRGEWIGERTTAPALFPLDREQGALFD